MSRHRWIPPIALMLVIFAVSSIPGDDESTSTLLGFIPPAVQNFLHVPIYALLTVLWWRALQIAAATLVAILVSLGWGVIDELHQLYIPGRYASLTDITLNSIGVLLGWIGLSHWQRTQAH
ncbi:MAG: VanZ family protein [Gammaproteobacteria bacterium]|nr:VanZ family protein [Gammaproteobacteria bacterium]